MENPSTMFRGDENRDPEAYQPRYPRSPGEPPAVDSGAPPQPRYYSHTAGPGLTAVKDNMNHMSGLNLAFRVTVFVLSLIAFSVMAAANENGAHFATFTTFSFVVAINVIVCFYCIVQIILTILSLTSGNSPSMMYAFVTFGFDQLFAFLLMSAGSAGASLNLVLNHHGVLDAVGNGCTDGHIIVFCSETEAAVAFTFLAFLVMEASALLAGYGLGPYLIVR